MSAAFRLFLHESRLNIVDEKDRVVCWLECTNTGPYDERAMGAELLCLQGQALASYEGAQASAKRLRSALERDDLENLSYAVNEAEHFVHMYRMGQDYDTRLTDMVRLARTMYLGRGSRN